MKQVFDFSKNRIFWGIAVVWLSILLFLTMSLSVLAQADLTTTVDVDGLIVSSTANSTKDWTASDKAVTWSQQSAYNSSNCSYTPYKGELTFQNNSGATKVLSFDYSLTEMGTGSVSGLEEGKTSFSKVLNHGDTYTITVFSSSDDANTVKVTITNIKLAVEEFSVTFQAPDVSMGSYTVNNEAIIEATTMTAPSTTVYTLQAAPLEKYVFDGWYQDGVLLSAAKTYSTSFAATCNVAARFSPDPLYAIATAKALDDGSYGNVDDLVSINSRYYHDPYNALAENGGRSDNTYICYYTKTGTAQTAGSLSAQYVPSLQWTLSDGKVVASASGTATGEYETLGLSRSWAYANMVTDVIQIHAKEDCVITITYSLTSSGGTTFPALRYLDSVSGQETISAIPIELDANKAEADGSFEYSLMKGHYLYVYTNGYHQTDVSGGFIASLNYSDTASITSFSVTKNNKKYTLSSTAQDNIGTTLTGGSIKIGTDTYSINADGKLVDAGGNLAGLEYPENMDMTLSVVSCPSNYYFLGWMINGDRTKIQSTPTYEYTMTEDITVDPIFVPSQVTLDITTDSATQEKIYTYTYLDTNGNCVPFSGQYVARNHDSSAFYETLVEGFDAEGEVILLGNMTIKGALEIPSGEMLVVPCSMSEVFVKSGDAYEPLTDKYAPSPYIYASLTLDGTIAVNGALMVSGNQYCATGGHSNAQGTMNLLGSSTVTVDTAGAFYSYGYVEGTGTIIAKGDGTNGAQIHELCDIVAMPHPIVMQSLVKDKNIMPMNVYYLNSIRAKTKYEPGATLAGHFSMQYDATTKDTIKIFAPSDACFTVTSGTITKSFDPDLGQIIVNVDPDATVETNYFQLNVTAKLGTDYTLNLNSNNVLVPLASGWRLNVEGDLTVKHGFKLLPGAVMDVKPGGKLEITDNGKLVFYRLNDYDYRYNNAVDEEHIGYNVVGYPVNISGYGNFNIENVGSAKLNVDGELIANGKLFVTESLIGVRTETDATLTYKNFTHYANGFNNLTGTGSIDMGTGTTSTIQEYVVHHTNRDVTLADITIVPMKGLPVGASRDGVSTPVDAEGTDPNGVGEYVGLTGTVYGMEAIGTDIYGNADQTIYVWTNNPCEAGRHTDAADGNLVCDNCDVKLAKLVSMNANADAETELVFSFYVHSSFDETLVPTVVFGTENSTDFTYTLSDDATSGNKILTVLQPVASGEMTKPVTISLAAGETAVPISANSDGSCVESVSSTVAKYAQLVLKSNDSSLTAAKDLVDDLLSYGSYAQIYFKTQTGYDDIQNLESAAAYFTGTSSTQPSISGVTVDSIEKTCAVAGDSLDISYKSMEGFLGSAIQLNVNFNVPSGFDMNTYSDTYKFEVTYKGKKTEVPLKSFTASDGTVKYYVEILNIPAAYLDYDYIITVTNITNGASFTVTTSVLAYLKNILAADSGASDELRNLACAMYLYNDAANTFFGK